MITITITFSAPDYRLLWITSKKLQIVISPDLLLATVTLINLETVPYADIVKYPNTFIPLSPSNETNTNSLLKYLIHVCLYLCHVKSHAQTIGIRASCKQLLCNI